MTWIFFGGGRCWQKKIVGNMWVVILFFSFGIDRENEVVGIICLVEVRQMRKWMQEYTLKISNIYIYYVIYIGVVI